MPRLGALFFYTPTWVRWLKSLEFHWKCPTVNKRKFQLVEGGWWRWWGGSLESHPQPLTPGTRYSGWRADLRRERERLGGVICTLSFDLRCNSFNLRLLISNCVTHYHNKCFSCILNAWNFIRRWTRVESSHNDLWWTKYFCNVITTI